ncbi:hypothetical protein GQ651_12280 [Alphaproteobacteria bacterium GH1-50]|uniref:Lipoprotein n=1 Tax=Kangsaoukella pontilimi TaxID=2691042 RepID=A0A7C9IGX2_9RHOB|nr:hypothetical protein [Kangsaoukella pontilimi]MXQ08624.1 hypothetical protein [Kangsaoukella pontilimi]
MKKLTCALLATGLLAGCATTGGRDGDFFRELPEGMAELAAPNQDLTRVTLLEEDNCFWYEHDGPVETTLLPLRSKRGRHLCQATAEESA